VEEGEEAICPVKLPASTCEMALGSAVIGRPCRPARVCDLECILAFSDATSTSWWE
jgi:hypothetical protein